jgi:single-stranded DNA-binding protein
MASLTVSGICRITRDAEVKKSSTGTWYSFGLAAYRKFVKDGKQAVDFFDCDLFQKEPKPGFEKKLTKGRLIYIESGYLRNDQFKGTDGKDKSRVKIQISTFELLQDSIAGSFDDVKSEPTAPPVKEHVCDHCGQVDKLCKCNGPVMEKYKDKPLSQSTHPSDFPPPSYIPKQSYAQAPMPEAKKPTPDDVKWPSDMSDEDEPPF